MGEGVLGISSDGDDRRIFFWGGGGLKFSIPEHFWVTKFGKYFFGWLELTKVFWGINSNLKICGNALTAS